MILILLEKTEVSYIEFIPTKRSLDPGEFKSKSSWIDFMIFSRLKLNIAEPHSKIIATVISCEQWFSWATATTS